MSDDARTRYWQARLAVPYHHVAGRVGGTVVDVGCGSGHGLSILRAGGARGVIGLDWDPAVVQQARATHATEAVEVVEADLTDLPLVNDTYDLVMATHVVEHIADDDLFLSELVRITRPGGHVVVCTPNRRTFRPRGVPDTVHPGHVREYDPQQLLARLEGAGARVTELLGVHHVPGVASRLRASFGPHATSLLADSPWPSGLDELLAEVTTEDFPVHDGGVDGSLDVVAWATA